MTTFSSARRRRAAVAVAGVVVLAGLGGAPALGLALPDDGGGGQPPAGTRPAGPPETDFKLGKQPPPGARGPARTDFRLGSQPANPNPDLRGKPTTVRIPERQQGGNIPSTHGARTEGRSR